jgi:uncharacterized protein YidB (DUF937 family)
MGLLDSVIGALSGGTPGQQGGQADLLQAAIGMLAGGAQGGGLSGLIAKFQQGGLGDVASSWVGSGQNLPISADQLQSVLGSDAVAGLAAKFGLSASDVSGQLAHLLPQAVDHLTPGGQLPESGGLGDIGAMLGKFQPR